MKTFPYRPVQLSSTDLKVGGFWRLFAFPFGANRPGWQELTRFRGSPTKLSRMSFGDPFGARDLTITFPQITPFDRRGRGDLDWCRKYAGLLLRWHGNLPSHYPRGKRHPGRGEGFWSPQAGRLEPGFTWSGYMNSFADSSSDGLTVTCKGAMYTLDGFLAKPSYPPQPVPYEWAIRDKFLHHPSLPLRRLQIHWPEWYSHTYDPPAKGTPAYLVPAHVKPGEFWTGLLTRQTGSWDPTLSSYIQGLLSAMYTAHGRWTIDMFDGNQPVLMHRDRKFNIDTDTVVVDATLSEACELDLNEDWSQALSVVYGQGTSLAGEQYSGMQISPDGALTDYEPLAALRQVHPEDRRGNDWFDSSRLRQEVMLQMQTGLNELDAGIVGSHHLRQFADPGVTGTVTLKADPTMNGAPLNRMLVTAGMHMHLPSVHGPSGLHLHVTENEVNFEEGTNTCTVDSKFRDRLTVREVKMRGRDALQIPRMLTVGQWSPPIPDQLLPWDYSAGSGYIPSHPDPKVPSALELFDGMPDDVKFPWTDWTTKRPPGHHRWKHCYVHIPPARRKADNNWAFLPLRAGITGRSGIPVRLAQSGQIRLLQIAAYDSDGNVLPVSFHVSLYQFYGVNVNGMPLVPDNDNYHPYKTTQHYPFGKDAWETFNADGTQKNPAGTEQMPAVSGGLVRGWGDYYERAGYSPGLMSQDNPKTGLLLDESQWNFTAATTGKGGINIYSSTKQPAAAGYFYMMFYCDDQAAEDVYFLGRMFRVEPGATT